MSITDVLETDRHIGEVIPSMENGNATVDEGQVQEEGSEERQQNQSWIAGNKIMLSNQDTITEAIRSLETAEDCALHYLTQSVAKMMDNIGFSTCHESVLNILTDLCRRYMQKLWVDSKTFAEHAGRHYPTFEDANMVFGKLMFSVAELHAFMRQVQCDPLENRAPFFPVRKGSPNLLSIYGPVSDKELAERPEHIPRYFPALHPEWCEDHEEVRPAEVSAMKGTVQEVAKNIRFTSRKRVTKPKISFPDFSGSTAKELGFIRPQKLPPKKVFEEPSGISSSANIAALQVTGIATNSAIKAKPKNRLIHESANSLKHSDEHGMKAESLKEKDASNKSFAQRSIGMFGMPPSALVYPKSVAIETMKKKKKKDRDRTKGKKVKHRDKEKPRHKNEEDPSACSSIPVTINYLTNEKASTSASCSTDTNSDSQAKKSGDQLQDVLLPALQKQPCLLDHNQSERNGIDLKNVANKKPLIDVHFPHAASKNDGEDIVDCGKEDGIGRFKQDQPVDFRVNDGQSYSGIGSHMTEVLIPQHFANRTGDLEECGDNVDSKNVEKAKREVEDKTQKNDKTDADKSLPDEMVKEKLEKRKNVEKGNEWKTFTKKITAESSLSVIVDSSTKSSTNANAPISHDLKALKVVLSRPTGQKVFTALSPSNSTDRAVKDVEKCGAGSVQSCANATLFTVDELKVPENICEKKKKHKKEKDHDKHRSKEHKRKDKNKSKEHKKNKAKDREKKCIKLRPDKLCLKRPGEHMLPTEMPAPKIPKLKIRFGSNSSGIGASPSDTVSSSTILTSFLSSTQLSEKDATTLVDQNDVMQSTIKEDAEATGPYTLLKSDGIFKPRKRQPVTKAELKALPKLPLKTRTCGTKEGIGLTGGQKSAEGVVTSVIPRANAGFEKRNYMQLPTGKRLRVDDGQKEFSGSSFDICGSAAYSSTKKVFKTVGKERSNESCVQGMTLKDLKELALTDTYSAFFTHGQRQEKEPPKRELEDVLKRKPDQAHAETELDPGKSKSAKEKDSFRRVCDDDLLFDKKQSFDKNRFLGKLSNKEPEKKKKDRHQNFQMMKENGSERGSQHVQKVAEKEKDQSKRDEKDLGIADEKKEAQQDRQKGKGSNGEKKKGSDESGKGKEKKMRIVGARSGDVSVSWTTGNDRKHREELIKFAASGEQPKRKSMDKNEERRKDGEKDAKKFTKERGCSSGTKERGKHHNEVTHLEEKVKSCNKEFKDKEKRKKHSSSRSREHNSGKSWETENVSSYKDEGCGGLSNTKTKKSDKDEITGDSNNQLPHDFMQKTERAIIAKEQLSKRCSSDSDIFGSGSSTADSVAKSSDKKSATLDSDDSLDTMWICPECSVAYVEGATDMVGCDACDNWFHWSCVGLLVAPPDDAPWYCQNCAKKKLKKKSMLKSSSSKRSKK